MSQFLYTAKQFSFFILEKHQYDKFADKKELDQNQIVSHHLEMICTNLIFIIDIKITNRGYYNRSHT